MKTITLSLLITAISVIATAQVTGKPNIIIILADDYGYGDVQCYGSKRFKTPNIDALAAGGIRFTDFHSNGAVCSPTRAALLTGRYQQRTGINGVVTAAGHRHTGLDLKEMTFAELLKPVGYATALFGKWHVGYKPDYNPVSQGFDEFIGYVSGNIDYHNHLDQTGAEDWWKQDKLTPEEGYSTDLITKHSVDFIERNKDTPFLLYIAHEAPHYPFQGRLSPPRYTRENGRTKDPVTLNIYKEMIEVMDENIGRVVKAVNDAGLQEKTFIIFLSDNGPSSIGSAGPLRGKKGQIWEGGHRVPAIAYWPDKIKPGGISDATAMGADIFTTIAAVSNTPLPEEIKLDGINLLPHLTNGESLPRRSIFWGIGKHLAIRRDNYKLVTNYSFSKTDLYDLKADPGEKTNIAGEKPEKVKELMKLLKAWHKDVNANVKKRT